MNIDELRKRLIEENPEYEIVPKGSSCNIEGISYKDLYTKQTDRIMAMERENQEIGLNNQRLEKEIQDITNERDQYKKQIEEQKGNNTDILKRLYDALVIDRTSINNIEAYDLDGDKITALNDNIKINEKDLSDKPAVYNFNRPSFIALADLNEFNKKNLVAKEKDKTKHLLLERLQLIKKLKDKTPDEAADLYDKRRKSAILDICNNKGYSNSERYVRYYMLNPGMKDSLINVLDKAAELGLNAKVIISLLEQPQESFNEELVSIFVNSLYKGNEYNLKQELAEDLVKGNWYIVSEDKDKKKIKYALVPFYEFEELKRQISQLLSVTNTDLNNSDNTEEQKSKTEDIGF